MSRQQPVRGLSCHAQEERIRGRERRLRRDREQLAVVVQHLLEVRDHPVGVDRIPAEAAAELIVDAALGHAREGERRHVERLEVGLIVASADARQLRSRNSRFIGCGNLGAWPKPPNWPSNSRVRLSARGRERRAIERRAVRRGRRQKLAEHLDQRVALPLDVRAVVAVVLGDALAARR